MLRSYAPSRVLRLKMLRFAESLRKSGRGTLCASLSTLLRYCVDNIIVFAILPFILDFLFSRSIQGHILKVASAPVDHSKQV